MPCLIELSTLSLRKVENKQKRNNLCSHSFCFFGSQSFPFLLGLVLRLDAHDSTAPFLSHIFVAIRETGVAAFNDLCQLCLVFWADLSECDSCGGLDVNGLTQASRASYNAVRYIHLAAKRRKPNDELDGINVMGDHDQRSLLLFDKFSDMVDTKLKTDRPLCALDITTGFASLTDLGQTLSLLNRRLWLVLRHELEEGTGRGGIHGQAELVDCRRNLETHEKDLALTLKAHVLGPPHVTTERHTLGKNILSDPKVLGALLKQGVLRLLDGGLLDRQRCRSRCTRFSFALALTSRTDEFNS